MSCDCSWWQGGKASKASGRSRNETHSGSNGAFRNGRRSCLLDEGEGQKTGRIGEEVRKREREREGVWTCVCVGTVMKCSRICEEEHPARPTRRVFFLCEAESHDPSSDPFLDFVNGGHLRPRSARDGHKLVDAPADAKVQHFGGDEDQGGRGLLFAEQGRHGGEHCSLLLRCSCAGRTEDGKQGRNVGGAVDGFGGEDDVERRFVVWARSKGRPRSG